MEWPSGSFNQMPPDDNKREWQKGAHDNSASPRSRKKKPKTHVASYEIFMKHVKYRKTETSTDVVDVSGLFTQECVDDWLKTRAKRIINPHESYRRVLTAHVRGSDERRPFDPPVEKAILERLRTKEPWSFSKSIGTKGFRGLGYHESKQQQDCQLKVSTTLSNPVFSKEIVNNGTAIRAKEQISTNLTLFQCKETSNHNNMMGHRNHCVQHQNYLAEDRAESYRLITQEEILLFKEIYHICATGQLLISNFDIARITLYLLFDPRERQQDSAFNLEKLASRAYRLLGNSDLGSSLNFTQFWNTFWARNEGALLPCGNDIHGRPIMCIDMNRIISFDELAVNSNALASVYTTDLMQARTGSIHIYFCHGLSHSKLTDLLKNFRLPYIMSDVFTVSSIIYIIDHDMEWFADEIRKQQPEWTKDILSFIVLSGDFVPISLGFRADQNEIHPRLGGTFQVDIAEFLKRQLRLINRCEKQMYQFMKDNEDYKNLT